jgi:hypothetical protein
MSEPSGSLIDLCSPMSVTWAPEPVSHSAPQPIMTTARIAAAEACQERYRCQRCACRGGTASRPSRSCAGKSTTDSDPCADHNRLRVSGSIWSSSFQVACANRNSSIFTAPLRTHAENSARTSGVSCSRRRCSHTAASSEACRLRLSWSSRFSPIVLSVRMPARGRDTAPPCWWSGSVTWRSLRSTRHRTCS